MKRPFAYATRQSLIIGSGFRPSSKETSSSILTSDFPATPLRFAGGG
jgi:hypothetical protein